MSAATKPSRRAPPTRIFLVDDHLMMRQGIAQLIAEDALRQIEKLKPDVALVDITLRSTNGLELIREPGFGLQPQPCLSSRCMTNPSTPNGCSALADAVTS